jgi:hypothetical protein
VRGQGKGVMWDVGGWEDGGAGCEAGKASDVTSKLRVAQGNGRGEARDTVTGLPKEVAEAVANGRDG